MTQLDKAALADELEERFWKFKSLELPGQPQMMHLGSMQLVDDMWREIKRLRSADRMREEWVIEVESGIRWSIVCHCGSQDEAEQRARGFRPMACFSGRELRIRQGCASEGDGYGSLRGLRLALEALDATKDKP